MRQEILHFQRTASAPPSSCWPKAIQVQRVREIIHIGVGTAGPRADAYRREALRMRVMRKGVCQHVESKSAHARAFG